MGTPKTVILPTIYNFEVGMKVKARNSITGEIFFGRIQSRLPICHGYIVETTFDKKCYYFEGKEIEADDRR